MGNIANTNTIPDINKLAYVLNVKNSKYEFEDLAARQAIDILNGDDQTNGSVVKTITDAITAEHANIVGINGDDKDQDTIFGAKAYAKDLINTVLGEDIDNVQQTWETIQNITDELTKEEGGIANTILDKLVTLTDGFGNKTVKAYIDDSIEGLDTTESGSAGNVGVEITQTDGLITGVTVTDQSINANDLSAKIGDIGSNVTVKGYVDKAIEDLDTTESGSTGNVGVEITQTDGLITGVSVTDNSINATDLSNKIGAIPSNKTVKEYIDDNITTLTTQVEDNELVIATALTDLNTRLQALEAAIAALQA